MFFVSAHSKGLSVHVSRLFSTLTGKPISVYFKGGYVAPKLGKTSFICIGRASGKKTTRERVNEACTNKKSGSRAAALQTHVYLSAILDEG
jgi:hypothetical protein